MTNKSLTLRLINAVSAVNKAVSLQNNTTENTLGDVSVRDRLNTVGAGLSNQITMKKPDTQNIPVVKIYDASADLTKRWFVFYNFNYQGSQFSKRFKEYGNVNSIHDLPERYRAIIALQNSVTEKLSKGFNPFEYEKETAIDKLNQKSIAYLLLAENKEHKRYLRKKSGSSYESHLNGFIAWLEYAKYKNATSITNTQAHDFLNYLQDIKNVSNTTRNAYLATLRSYFDRLKITPNPFNDIKKITEYRQGKLPFSDEQKLRIIAYVKVHDEQLWFSIQMLYYCMIRPNEQRFLKLEHFDFENWLIRVPGEVSKNKKTQFVEIPTPFREYLKSIRIMNNPKSHYIFSHGGKPGTIRFSRDNFGKRHKEILKKLGISSAHSFYSWKHTGAVDLVKAGVGLKAIQIQFRHHDLNTLNIYLESMGANRNTEIIDSGPRI